MSKVAVPEPGLPLESDMPLQHDTAGAMLRAARQSQGMDIGSLSALLKVPVHKLQALEQDQPELLADAVFARALASSMCRTLKLDPAPVLHRLPAISAFKVTSQNRGINSPFRAPSSGRNAAPILSHISRPVILVGVALLLGALVLMFLPSIEKEIAWYRQSVQPGIVPGLRVESASGSVTTTVVTAASPVGDVSGATSAAAGTADAPTVVTQAMPLPTLLPSPGADAASTEPAMRFSAKGASNIKVTDANGMVVLDRALKAGESASVSGALPLAAVVSRASVIQVQVRGQAFDLAGVTSNNIARFEVK